MAMTGEAGYDAVKAGKAGNAGRARVLADDSASHGAGVNAGAPGGIRTGSQAPFERE